MHHLVSPVAAVLWAPVEGGQERGGGAAVVAGEQAIITHSYAFIVRIYDIAISELHFSVCCSRLRSYS